MYQTKAICFKQNGRVFYTVAIPAGKLVEMSKVDVWDPDNPMNGYQRAPSSSRKRQIGQYAMKKDSIMPVGGLLNARGLSEEDESYGRILEFDEEYVKGKISFGTLTIPNEALPLYIVDMQHRLGGYKWAIEDGGADYLAEFPLTVTIADGLSKMEEVDQFDIINTTQKKVRTDLARRIKTIQSQDVDRRLGFDQLGKLWEVKGPVITQILNTSQGIWLGKILPPNKSKKDQATMVVRETSFVTSMKPILQTPFFSRQTEELSAELIKRYWAAIERIWPEAFNKPEDYVIQKTPGVFSLHALAPEVFELARGKGEVTEDKIFEVVKSLSEIGGSDYWEADNYDGAASYGSMKGFKILAAELRQYLPEITLAA